MADRNAVDTIKGYFYQFDYTIIKLLELTQETDTITVEGIEDVDISTATEETAVQCKYYAKSEYNHSTIAKPIRLMLNHYKEVVNNRRHRVRYKLYGFFKSGQSKLTLPIDATFLKNHFLTFTEDKIKKSHHLDLNLTDKDLDDFITLLDINILALEYEKQISRISSLLIQQLTCTSFEADHFFYNNALKVIKEISIQSNETDRKINKRDFLIKINNKKALFNTWFVSYKGEEKWFLELRNQYFSSLNISSFERFFIIEIPTTDYTRSDLKELMFTIARKWSKNSSREPNPFCPYLYLHNIDSQELLEIKNELHQEEFIFIDGYDFNGASFSAKSLSQKINSTKPIKLKIINRLEYIDLTLNEITKTKEIYQFFNHVTFFNKHYPNVKQVEIQFNKLKDIKKII